MSGRPPGGRPPGRRGKGGVGPGPGYRPSGNRPNKGTKHGGKPASRGGGQTRPPSKSNGCAIVAVPAVALTLFYAVPRLLFDTWRERRNAR